MKCITVPHVLKQANDVKLAKVQAAEKMGKSYDSMFMDAEFCSREEQTVQEMEDDFM